MRCGAARKYSADLGKCGTNTADESFPRIGGTLMTLPALESACALAWRNYLLIHNDVSESDDRRGALHRYLTDLYQTGEYDFDLLQIAAVAY
jgi:hypothetical protein